MLCPGWYGIRCPSYEELVIAAEQMGALVTWVDTGGEGICIAGAGHEPPVIVVPAGPECVCAAWVLAHEIGHLVHHLGALGEHQHAKGESTADRWAARALIPNGIIQTYARGEPRGVPFHPGRSLWDLA